MDRITENSTIDFWSFTLNIFFFFFYNIPTLNLKEKLNYIKKKKCVFMR